MGRAIKPVRRCSLYGATNMLTLSHSPFDLFERLEQQIASAERVPNAEIVETESGYVVRLELPGVQRDSIDIKATDRNLVISAERTPTGDAATVLMSEKKERKKEKKKKKRKREQPAKRKKRKKRKEERKKKAKETTK